MKHLKGRPHIVLVGLVVLILVAESALFYAIWTSFAASEQWSFHTHEVLEKIESFLSEMKDAETGQRGYLLTGKDQYLEPYDTAVRAVPVLLEELRKLTSDNPSQQSRIETLRALMTAKLAVLQETIELRRTRGFDQALEVVSSDRGQQIMDRIRVVIQEMKSDELSLLDRRNQTRLATARFLILTMASGVGLLLIVLVAGSRAIDRSTTARAFAEAAERTQRERRHARSLLEASLDPLVTISPDGRITDANEAAEQVRGVPRDRLVGSDFSDYFTEPERARAGYRKVLSDGLVRDYPLTIRHHDGHTTDVLYNAVVYRNQAGQVQGVFAAARDVTHRKRAEAELTHYREHLEELVQQRTGELEAANAHLRRTTAELASSNQELEQFAYVASTTSRSRCGR